MLSVILPNYNHSMYLPEAFGSLLKQVRPADELIVIDDASTDDSVAIIESFLPRFANARLVKNNVNIGTVANMNLGLKLLRGDFVAFVAADDVVYPNYFQRTLEMLEAFPMAPLASGRTGIIDAKGAYLGPLATYSPRDTAGFIAPEDAARHLMQDDSWFTGNVSVFRTEYVLREGGFPLEYSSFTDGIVSRTLVVKHGACYIPETLGVWRRMEGGLAWREGENLDRISEVTMLIRQRMETSDAPFVPGYPERWRSRAVFGTNRFVLRNARLRAKSEGVLKYTAALVRECVQSVLLFLKLRPYDLFPVLGRRIRRMFSHKPTRAHFHPR